MFIDRTIDPTAAQVRALRDQGPEGEITMVNLLKFREFARYEPGGGDTTLTGREAYALYQHAFSVAVADVSQAQILYEGPVNQLFIGTASEETDWDAVLIVRYPSRAHFLAMMADARYRHALVHRYAGLERTILLQCGR